MPPKKNIEFDSDSSDSELEFLSDEEPEKREESDSEDEQPIKAPVPEVIKSPVLITEQKRKLTEDEKYDILDFLKVDETKDWETSIAVLEETRTGLLKQMEKIEIYPCKIPSLKAKMEKMYHSSKIDPGSSVGADASLALGEPTTQLTLNSVDYEELVMIKNKDDVTVVKIGEYIDNMIENSDEVDFYPENRTEYASTMDLDLEIPTVDEDGKMHWKKIEGVTRHPPPNVNGELKLLKVTTMSGRVVTATASKSFLLRKNNKIVAVNGSDLKIGDRLPVTIQFPKVENPLQEISMDKYLPKDVYVYGTDLHKAREIKEDYRVNGKNGRQREEGYTGNPKNPGWWRDNHGVLFTLPFGRSDAAMDSLNGKKKELIGKEHVLPGFIYTLHRNKRQKDEAIKTCLPEKIPLDNDFGFLIGAYLAEGHCTNTGTQLCISNNDPDFRERIINWCDKYRFGYHIQCQTDKNFAGATSTDVRIHSTMLVDLFTKMCDNYSHRKYVPYFAYISNEEFLKGLIDGYFSGDGTVTKDYIGCCSVSEKLIDGINCILNMFGIFSRKYTRHATKNNVGSKNILRSWSLSIGSGNIHKFYNSFTFTLKYKQEKLRLIAQKKFMYMYGRYDIIPEVNTETIKGDIHRDVLKKIDLYGLAEDDQDNIMAAIDSEVFFDEIKSIEKVDSTTKYVYDFTVEDTRKFTLFNGVSVEDTFHSCGISAANVTLGVPRLDEILNASKNQKTNVLSVKLNKSSTDLTNLQQVKDKCRPMLEERYVDQCVTSHKIVHLNYDSLSDEDKVWYGLFDMFYTTSYRECEWCIRLNLDKYSMFQFKLTTEMIAKKIENEYKDCKCVFSPDNIAIVDVYIETSNLESPEIIISKKKGKKTELDENKKSIVTEENKEFMFVSRVALDYIMNIKLTGIEGITKVYYQLNSKTKEWEVETAGTNMRDVMNLPEVDFKHVISNNMWEILNTLGVEAARRFLISEITSILSFGGTFIDPVHPTLLADSMTSTGTITSVNRYGISKSVVGVLTPASFEQSHQNMLDAPARGVTDDLTTVSANIITAKHVGIGTGYFGLMTDTNKLMKMQIPKQLPKIQEEVDNIPEDPRFSTSNAVFKNRGIGNVVERNPKEKESVQQFDNEDF